MTKTDLENLIKDKPDDIKSKAVLLYNAFVKNQLSYRDNPTDANRRNMSASEEALEDFRAQIGGGKSGDAFLNLQSVLQHLQSTGWKVTKTSLYRHQKEGKILPQTDGAYSPNSVEKYAKTFLKQTATGKRLQQNTDELQRQKLAQELKNLELRNERETFNYAKDRALYIPKDQVDIEIAGCCSVIYAGMKNMIMTESAGLIVAVGGDPRKVGELIQLLSNKLDETMNGFSSSREYEITIEAEPETDALQEETEA